MWKKVWIEDRIKSAYKAFNAPEPEELFNHAQNLDEQINIESPLQKAITKLSLKIEWAETAEERYILEEQLNQINEINKLYQKSKNKYLTNQTKLNIKSLLNWIELQINSKKNIINDDLLSLEKIIKNEENKLEDTLDIISANTIRDTIENNMNIAWIKESVPNESYQVFFDLVTITYIDFLENKIKRQINTKEGNILIKNEWLYLSKDEAKVFIWNLLSNINNSEFNIDFDFSLNLKKWNYKQTVTVNLNDYKNVLVRNQKNEEIVQKLKKYREEEEIRTRLFEENMRDLSSKERMDYIEKLIDNEEFRPYLLSVIKIMEWKTIYLQKNKQVKLSKAYINENSDKLIKNLKTLILLIIEIESEWFSKAQNPISSAEWLWQWLSLNGRISTEYMYNKKWYSKEKKWIKPTKVRRIRLTSSFETTLRNVKRSYPDQLLKELDFIPNKFNKKINLRPIDLTLRQQIKLLILDLWSNTKKVRNWAWNLLWIKDYLWTVILWNKWATKEIYKIFHHTKPDKLTLERIDNIISKYSDNLNKKS